MNSEVWISVMWGFVLAALRVGIPISLTNVCVTNFKGQPWRASSPGHAQIVHYCYGDEFFDKRRFMSEGGALSAVWRAEAPEGTASGVVTQALREAAEFYGFA